MRTTIGLCALVLMLAGCGGGDPGFVRLGDYECDAGEAVVRHLLKTMPDVSSGLSKQYCIIKALDLRAVDPDFTKRFADLNLTFVNRDVLIEQADTHFPIHPITGLSPYLLQLRTMHRLPDGAYDVEGAWAYKGYFDRRIYHAVPGPDAKSWKVTETKFIEGNAPAPHAAP